MSRVRVFSDDIGDLCLVFEGQAIILNHKEAVKLYVGLANTENVQEGVVTLFFTAHDVLMDTGKWSTLLTEEEWYSLKEDLDAIAYL